MAKSKPLTAHDIAEILYALVGHSKAETRASEKLLQRAVQAAAELEAPPSNDEVASCIALGRKADKMMGDALRKNVGDN